MTAQQVRRPGYQRVPRPRRDPRERRWSVVYGIPTLPVDKRTGQVIPGLPPVVGYIGQSVQTVKQRELQHRPTQPFGDVICGGSWVIEEGLWTQAELDARERHYIKHGVVLIPGQRAQRPVYNYEHNLDNPDRIEVWRAREHRQAREPGWVPSKRPVRVTGENGGPPLALVWLRQAVGWLRRVDPKAVARWTPVAVLAVWVAVVGASGPVATWVDGLAYGGGVGVVVAGLCWPKRRRRRRR